MCCLCTATDSGRDYPEASYDRPGVAQHGKVSQQLLPLLGLWHSQCSCCCYKAYNVSVHCKIHQSNCLWPNTSAFIFCYTAWVWYQIACWFVVVWRMKSEGVVDALASLWLVSRSSFGLFNLSLNMFFFFGREFIFYLHWSVWLVLHIAIQDCDLPWPL